jgi:hypothetical protein
MVYPTYEESTHSLLVTYYGSNGWGRVPLTTNGINPAVLSKDFTIYPVSPNPFGSDITIRFDLNKQKLVRLDVYNSAGAWVSTLVNSEKEPGSHSVVWTGIDMAGHQVENGLYFIRMALDGTVNTQSAILIK